MDENAVKQLLEQQKQYFEKQMHGMQSDLGRASKYIQQLQDLNKRGEDAYKKLQHDQAAHNVDIVDAKRIIQALQTDANDAKQALQTYKDYVGTADPLAQAAAQGAAAADSGPVVGRADAATHRHHPADPAGGDPLRRACHRPVRPPAEIG